MALHPDCAHYECVTDAEALASGFHAVTRPYGVRRSDQRQMLASAIRDLGTEPHKLVLVGQTITIYRK